jgi:SAM-dependent methyltransferase
MDAGRLEFPDGSFGLVTAGFVMQILNDPAAALAEMRRVLTPGGTIALSLETQSVGRLQWLYDLNLEFLSGGRPAPADDQVPGPMTHEQLDTLIAAAGFADLTRQSVAMPKTLANHSALWNWLSPRGLADAVAKLPPDRASDFHAQFHAGAENMQATGGIVLEFAATLHRAHAPH